MIHKNCPQQWEAEPDGLVCNLSLLTNDSKLRDLCWFCFYLFCCCSIEMSHSMCIIVQSIINVSAAMGRGGHK